MKIKKFQAENMKDALRQIKEELGPEAVILKTNKIKGNGLLRSEMIEVTAALDVSEDEYIPTEALNSIEPRQSDFKAESFAFEEEEEQKSFVEIPEEPEYVTFQWHDDEKIRYFQKILYRNEISGYYIEQVTKNVLRDYRGTLDYPEVFNLFKNNLKTKINVSGQLLLRRNRATVVTLIGPTGVGKTTSIAKLATNFALFGKLDVGLITFDTYRVAAVEQLKTYARIVDLPIKVVYEPSQVQDAIDEFRDKNLIFIDTAGRSQKDEAQIRELQEYVQVAQPDEVHLVLSATTKFSDNMDVIKRFGIIPIHKLIFTKLDETEYYGMIFNIMQRIPKSISYFTTGQNVPEDIELASPDYLLKNLLGEVNVSTGG